MIFFNTKFNTCFNCGCKIKSNNYLCSKCNTLDSINENTEEKEIEQAIDTFSKDQRLIRAIVKTPDHYNKTLIHRRLYIEIEQIQLISPKTRRKAFKCATDLNLNITNELIELITNTDSSLHDIPISSNLIPHLSKTTLTRYYTNQNLTNEDLQQILLLRFKETINVDELLFLIERKDLDSITLNLMLKLSKDCKTTFSIYEDNDFKINNLTMEQIIRKHKNYKNDADLILDFIG